jgi:hypothetical protein
MARGFVKLIIISIYFGVQSYKSKENYVSEAGPSLLLRKLRLITLLKSNVAISSKFLLFLSLNAGT